MLRPETADPAPRSQIVVYGARADEPAARIRANVGAFCRPALPRAGAWDAIANASMALLEVAFPERGSQVVLAPVLRSGLAMLDVARRHFGGPTIWPVVATRAMLKSGTSPEFLRTADARGDMVLILDPIVATGATLLSVISELQRETARMAVCCCYAAPEGLQRIAAAFPAVTIHVGVLAEGVDSTGYLVPATHGDAGDKLFR